MRGKIGDQAISWCDDKMEHMSHLVRVDSSGGGPVPEVCTYLMRDPWYLRVQGDFSQMSECARRAVVATRFACIHEHLFHGTETLRDVVSVTDTRAELMNVALLGGGGTFDAQGLSLASNAALRVRLPSFRVHLSPTWKTLRTLLDDGALRYPDAGRLVASVVQSLAELIRNRTCPERVPIGQILVDVEGLASGRTRNVGYLACADHAIHIGLSTDVRPILRDALRVLYSEVERRTRPFRSPIPGRGPGQTVDRWLDAVPADSMDAADWLMRLAEWTLVAAEMQVCTVYIDSANVARQRYPSAYRWGSLAAELIRLRFGSTNEFIPRIVVARRTGDSRRFPEFFKALRQAHVPNMEICRLSETGESAGDQKDDIAIRDAIRRDFDARATNRAIFLSNDRRFWAEHFPEGIIDARVEWADPAAPEVRALIEKECV